MGRKLLLVFSAIVVAAALGATSAYADTISLNDSCSGSLTISGTSNPTVTGDVTQPGCFAYWESGASSTQLLPGWTFDSSGTPQFTVGTLNTGAGYLAGNITWSSFDSGSGALVGLLDVTGMSGFNGEYVVGNSYTFKLLVDSTQTAGVYDISTGEVPVPEPGSLVLLGTGLLGMAGFLRRRIGL